MDGSVGSPFLYIGVIFDVLIVSGNLPAVMLLFIENVIGSITLGSNCFSNLLDILSWHQEMVLSSLDFGHPGM